MSQPTSKSHAALEAELAEARRELREARHEIPPTAAHSLRMIIRHAPDLEATRTELRAFLESYGA